MYADPGEFDEDIMYYEQMLEFSYKEKKFENIIDIVGDFSEEAEVFSQEIPVHVLNMATEMVVDFIKTLKVIPQFKLNMYEEVGLDYTQNEKVQQSYKMELSDVIKEAEIETSDKNSNLIKAA